MSFWKGSKTPTPVPDPLPLVHAVPVSVEAITIAKLQEENARLRVQIGNQSRVLAEHRHGTLIDSDVRGEHKKALLVHLKALELMAIRIKNDRTGQGLAVAEASGAARGFRTCIDRLAELKV